MQADVETRKPCSQHFYAWLTQEWPSVLFVVSLIVVLHHLGPLAPLARISLFVLSSVHANTSSSEATEQSPIWLVSIDEVDFLTRYQERRPFLRCELANDLGKLLSARPKVLAVDLDLSPIAEPTHQEVACQGSLDSVIDWGARQSKIILIRPFATPSRQLSKARTQWMQARQGAYFTSAEIDIAFPVNAAIEFVCNKWGFAEQAYMAGHPSEPCDIRRAHSYALNYRAFMDNVFEQSVSQIDSELPELSEKTVFFGSRSGRADRVVTPLGAAHGVVVHAAKFATFSQPIGHPILSVLLDLVIASAFSLLTVRLKSTYTAIAGTDPEVIGPVMKRARTNWQLTKLAMAFLGGVAGALVAAWALVSLFGVVTEPILIALGLGFDAFVLAGWQLVGVEQPQHHRLGFGPGQRAWFTELRTISQRDPFMAAVAFARWLVFWGVVVLALGYTSELLQ